MIDEVAVIRSMHTGVNNHGQSIHTLNTGRVQIGRPALGSWLNDGLGSESENLPAFVVLTDPAGLPVEGVHNWSNGWLPSIFQGTVVQNEANAGRDHNTYGFSMWLAGGGVRGGITHGATDDFGQHATKDVVTHTDYHATLLHLFGLDPKQLIYRRNGREQSLIDGQSGRVVEEILSST